MCRQNFPVICKLSTSYAIQQLIKIFIYTFPFLWGFKLRHVLPIWHERMQIWSWEVLAIVLSFQTDWVKNSRALLGTVQVTSLQSCHKSTFCNLETSRCLKNWLNWFHLQRSSLQSVKKASQPIFGQTWGAKKKVLMEKVVATIIPNNETEKNIDGVDLIHRWGITWLQSGWLGWIG